MNDSSKLQPYVLNLVLFSFCDLCKFNFSNQDLKEMCIQQVEKCKNVSELIEQLRAILRK